MKQKSSYAGKILSINLSNRDIHVEELDPSFVSLFLGGRGFGSKILYDNVTPNIKPFDEENLIILTPGALVGTGVPAASRTTITTKSPLTEMHGDAHASGTWGASLKYAGYDCLIVKGKAEKPVYILIDDGRVEIRNASHLWGKNTSVTDKLLKEELNDPDISTVCIGPAGERLVRLAAIMHDGSDKGVNARCGVGAVMGSKNLKAIAARGTKDINLHDQEAYKKAYQEYLETIAIDPYVPPATKYGTCRFMYHRVKFGIHGAKNWRYGSFEWEPLDPEVFRSDYQVKASSCPMCPIMCRRDYRIQSGKYAGTVAKLEWECIARSITCGINNPEIVIYFSNLCNQLGLDVEGTGGTIAFAMECYEKGLLGKEDTDGLDLNFGNHEAFLTLTKKIAAREGLGDILAEGCYRASKIIGKGSEKFAIHVKGGEMTAGDPRGMPVRAVSYATSTRGSDHLRSNPYVEELITPEEAEKWFGSKEAADIYKGVKGKGRLLKWSEDFVTIGDILGLCKFAYYRSASFEYLKKKGLQLATKFYNACTGSNLSEEEMFKTGERIFNVEKAYNTREGADRKDDIIPLRFFMEPLIKDKIDENAVVDRGKFNTILEEYYKERGWDVNTGIPTREILERLQLRSIIQDLVKRGKLA